MSHRFSLACMLQCFTNPEVSRAALFTINTVAKRGTMARLCISNIEVSRRVDAYRDATIIHVKYLYLNFVIQTNPLARFSCNNEQVYILVLDGLLAAYATS